MLPAVSLPLPRFLSYAPWKPVSFSHEDHRPEERWSKIGLTLAAARVKGLNLSLGPSYPGEIKRTVILEGC